MLHGDKVTSISKSGQPPSNVEEDVAKKVTWIKGDPTKGSYVNLIKGSDAVVSCIGKAASCCVCTTFQLMMIL